MLPDPWTTLRSEDKGTKGLIRAKKRGAYFGICGTRDALVSKENWGGARGNTPSAGVNKLPVGRGKRGEGNLSLSL